LLRRGSVSTSTSTLSEQFKYKLQNAAHCLQLLKCHKISMCPAQADSPYWPSHRSSLPCHQPACCSLNTTLLHLQLRVTGSTHLPPWMLPPAAGPVSDTSSCCHPTDGSTETRPARDTAPHPDPSPVPNPDRVQGGSTTRKCWPHQYYWTLWWCLWVQCCWWWLWSHWTRRRRRWPQSR